MPRFVVDEVGLPLWKPVAPAGAINVGSICGLQSLKRGRPMEPQMPSGSCTWKCSAKTKSDVSVPLSESCHCSKDGPTPSCEDENFDSCIGFGGTAPHDEFGDFDLGPPPPSGPVLVRQNAMDFTASSEAKYAAASRKFEPTSMAIAGLMSTRGPALMMATPMLLRHNRPMGLK